MPTLRVSRGIDPWWPFGIRVQANGGESVTVRHGVKELRVDPGAVRLLAQLAGWNALPVTVTARDGDVVDVRVGVDARRALSLFNHFGRSVALRLEARVR